MAIYECDFELSGLVDKLDGTSANEPEYQDYVRTSVWPFVFGSTRAGQTMKAKYLFTDALQARFKQEFERRFGTRGQIKGGVDHPGVLYANRIEAVFADFLAANVPELSPIEEVEAPAVHVQTEDEKFASLVAQAQRDIADPSMSTVHINLKKQDFQYRKAFEYALAQSTAAGFGKTLTPAPKLEAPSDVRQFAHLLNDEIQARGVPRPAAGYFTIRADGREYKYPIQEFNQLSDEAVKFGLVR
jgi:hypothetical protein